MAWINPVTRRRGDCAFGESVRVDIPLLKSQTVPLNRRCCHQISLGLSLFT
ncbi:hypothetical protein V6S19_00605 [Klebsiella pneumoniae]